MDTSSYLTAAVSSLSKRWHDALLHLREISHPPSRQDHLDYLLEIYQEAQDIHDKYSQHIHQIQLGQLTHILNRKFEYHTLTTNLRHV